VTETTLSAAGLAKGERRRDAAHALLLARRAALVRCVQRALLRHLLDHGEDMIDPVRAAVPIPPGTDPRLVGAAVRDLALAGVIHSVGRRRSHRPEAHGRQVDLWAVADPAAAREWLRGHLEITNPEPDAPPAGLLF
jgi:hypothetical protein